MALPKFNDIPNYELTIPSTGKVVLFRPFLVKEQKVLLMALESNDEKQILRAITNTIESCILDPIDLGSLSTFDVEYIFIQVRTKSAGENSKVGIKCQSCEEPNEITIPLEDIVIDLPEKIKDVPLSAGWYLKLRYPKYEAMLEQSEVMDPDNQSMVGILYHTIQACIEFVCSEEERIQFDEYTLEEREEFLNQLTQQQFDEITVFARDLPKLRHEVNFTCEKCNTEQSRVLEGLQDFFQLPSLTTP
ncbi:MAG: hypothetical protein ACR2ON_09895 [Paracoccaceae bacterium]